MQKTFHETFKVLIFSEAGTVYLTASLVSPDAFYICSSKELAELFTTRLDAIKAYTGYVKKYALKAKMPVDTSKSFAIEKEIRCALLNR